jgi:ribulose 1,5-bisphosphate carboxylase large subunit-like protein
VVQNVAGIQGISPDQPVTSNSGIPGLQATYVGENRTGWYTVYLLNGTGVTVVVDGNDAGVTEHREELEASVRTVTIDQVA